MKEMMKQKRWYLLGVILLCVLTAGVILRICSTAEPSYRQYEGPILTLTAETLPSGISAERTVSFRPAGAADRAGWSAAEVSDDYILHNSGSQEARISLIYPFTGRLSSAALPTAEVNGAAVSCSFTPAEILGYYESHDYRSFSNGKACADVLQKALSVGIPAPSADRNVTLYRLCPTGTDQPVKLSCRFSAPVGSAVFCSGASQFSASGSLTGICSAEAPILLAIQGGTLQECTLTAEDAPSGAAAELKREESTLSAVLTELAGRMFPDKTEEEQVCYAAAALSLLAERGAEGYYAFLDTLLADAYSCLRLMYIRFEAVVPAGGSTEITLRQRKVSNSNMESGTADGRSGLGYELLLLSDPLPVTDTKICLLSEAALHLNAENCGFIRKDGSLLAELKDGKSLYFFEIRP